MPDLCICTDSCTEDENHVNKETLPPGDNINIILDKYRAILNLDEENMLVTVQGGHQPR
ncbi:MAG: hypothetical protein J4G05_06260 [Chlorobi bacterium]|nr:hypothetical protein [Chlorobiota bacterium]